MCASFVCDFACPCAHHLFVILRARVRARARARIEKFLILRKISYQKTRTSHLKPSAKRLEVIEETRYINIRVLTIRARARTRARERTYG